MTIVVHLERNTIPAYTSGAGIIRTSMTVAVLYFLFVIFDFLSPKGDDSVVANSRVISLREHSACTIFVSRSSDSYNLIFIINRSSGIINNVTRSMSPCKSFIVASGLSAIRAAFE